MKKFNFILFVLSLLIILPSCQRKHPTLYFFTDYLDMEYVYDYLPYEEGQILLFTNENKQGHFVEDCIDQTYLSQIICDITKDIAK